MSEGRTGVLLHYGERRWLLEVDQSGRLLGQRELLGPHTHHDELIREVDGRLMHVVAFDGGLGHGIDGNDRPVPFPSAPTELCTSDGPVDAASHLSPRVSMAGSTADPGMPRLWRTYWLSSTDDGTCIRAGFETHPPLAWWSDEHGVRGMTWDWRYGPTELASHEEEPASFPPTTAIQSRGASLVIGRFGSGGTRVVRVDGETTTELDVPQSLRGHFPITLGPGGVLFTESHAWVVGGHVRSAPAGSHIVDAILTNAAPPELYLLVTNHTRVGEYAVVDPAGEVHPAQPADDLVDPILAPSAGGPPTVVSRALVLGRGRTDTGDVRLLPIFWPSARSCAEVEIHGTAAPSRPPIDCRDDPIAAFAEGRSIAYLARALGELERTHVRIATRGGRRWVEGAPPLHVAGKAVSAIGVGQTLYVVTSGESVWTLHRLHHGRWTERDLPL
ncbi:MAG: hypothetical protein JJ863_07435 [Deltaproteobacteria bacterium]|nr:hypothetical protein [Deltaproteobacteria bacterium]